MHFDERDEGSFRIYAGALEAPSGEGYIAAVVVKRIDAGNAPAFYRDECLSGGHRWASASAALQFALSTGRKAIRAKAVQAVC